MRFRGVRKGSISIYMTLMLCVILLLIFACIDSARLYCGRAAISCAVDESMFSELSYFDKTLYEKYGLMFIDGGLGEKELKMGRIMHEANDEIEKVLYPGGHFVKNPGSLYCIEIESSSITGYQLATDNGYAPLKEEICELMKLRSGADIIESAGELLSSSGAARMFSFKDDNEIKALLNDYGNLKTASDNGTGEGEYQKAQTEEAAESAEASDADIKENVKDPVDNMRAVLDMGIYSFAIPAEKGISTAGLDKSSLVSSRKRSSGMGLMPDEYDAPLKKHYMVQYAVDFFPDYLSTEKSEGLTYQTEYIIEGKDTDSKNLRACIDRLLLMRMGFNYLHIISSPQKQAEAAKLAFILCSMFLSTEKTETVSQLIMLLWTYAESYTDIKTLLGGGKEPLFKDDESWQVSLDMLSAFRGETGSDKGKKGLGYSDYLKILLFMTAEDDMTGRIADLIEYNKRNKDKTPGFCLDNCLYLIEIGYEMRIGGHKAEIDRSYGYRM